MKPLHTLTVNGETYDLQDDRLDQGFRHIATVTQETDQQIRQMEITADSQGNPFTCTEFYILATLPPKEDTAVAGWSQIYINTKTNGNYDVYMAAAFSSTITKKYRIHLIMALEGGWIADIVECSSNENLANAALSNQANMFGTFRGKGVGGKSGKLFFATPSAYPKGTTFEVYGK